MWGVDAAADLIENHLRKPAMTARLAYSAAAALLALSGACLCPMAIRLPVDCAAGALVSWLALLSWCSAAACFARAATS